MRKPWALIAIGLAVWGMGLFLGKNGSIDKVASYPPVLVSYSYFEKDAIQVGSFEATRIAGIHCVGMGRG